MWLDEQIWGHRLYEKQSAWLVFLECLMLADACHREKKLLRHGTNYYPLDYKPEQRLYLRNILFNNEKLFQIAQNNVVSETAWKEWLAWMAEHARGVTPRDFSYLKARFHSFSDFAALVGMLRASAVESDSNKRWSSRFVFPFGAAAVYEDLAIKQDNPTREYINFGRSGELLYMMLARSQFATELVEVVTRILDGKNQWNALLKLMQPEPPGDRASRAGKSYLPYSHHSSFDRLASDWLAIDRLHMPLQDSIPHLVVLSTLGLLLYELEIASSWAGRPKPFFVCELVGPRKTLVREVSTQNYQLNALLPEEAIKEAIRAVEEGDAWKEASTDHGAYIKCKALLVEHFQWPDEDDYKGPHEPAPLIKELRSEALTRHKKQVAHVHRVFGREVGLVSKRGTNRLRYAPTDALLKALILANVEQRMEFNEFLERLYDRYGFVFGDKAAAQVLPKESFDQSAFRANSRRLEQRLTSLGMLNRLSDACAYVKNPFGRGPQ